MGTSKELYGLLELPRGASREDVRKAHRRLVRKYHPDANSGDNSTEERFKEVQHAYEVLSDPRKRWEYDEVLLRGSSRSEALSNLVRHVNSWKAGVMVLAFFLIINSFLFYRSEQPKNSVSELVTTAYTGPESDQSTSDQASPDQTGPVQATPVENPVTVNIQDDAFDPATTSIAPGTTVTWVNNDDEAHTVTADDGLFDSGRLDPGDSYSVWFDGSGTVAYHCEPHPHMTGSIEVGYASSSGERNYPWGF